MSRSLIQSSCLLVVGAISASQATQKLVLPTIKIQLQHKPSDALAADDNLRSRTPDYPGQSAASVVEQNHRFQISGSNPLTPIITRYQQRSTLLQNGIPFVQFSSAPPLINAIPSLSLTSITPIEHGSSVLYGNMTLGDSVNIQQIIGQPHQTLLASGQMPTGGKLAYQWADQAGPWQWQLTTDGQNKYGQRTFATLDQWRTQLMGNYESDQDQWHFMITHSSDRQQMPGALSEQQLKQDRNQTGNSRTKQTQHWVSPQLSWQHDWSDHWSSQLQWQGQFNKINGDIVSSNIPFEQQSLALLFRPRIIYQTATDKNQIGTQVTYQTFHHNLIIPEADQLNLALFDQYTHTINPTWQWGGGLRGAWSQTHGKFNHDKQGQQQQHVWAGNAFVKHHWTDDLDSDLSISHAYQLPFIDQSNQTAAVASGFGLSPETAWKTKLAQHFEHGPWQLDQSLYWLHIDNQIAFIMDGPQSAFNQNLPPIQTFGGDLDVHYHWHQWDVGGQVTVNHSTFINGSIDQQSVSGNQVPGAPLVSGRLSFNYQINPNWETGIQGQFEGAEYPDSDFQNQLGRVNRYALANWHLSYQHHGWQATLKINNLFNTHYSHYVTTYQDGQRYYYPADGINGFVQLQYQWA